MSLAMTVPALGAAAGEGLASGSWKSVHGDLGNTRFATMTQINRRTVSHLGAAWTFKFPQGDSSRATPVVHDGLLFVSAGIRIYALEADTGVVVWTLDTAQGEAPNPTDIIHFSESGQALPTNQGLSVGGGKVFAGLTDGSVIAIDEHAGKLAWRVSLADNPAKKVQNVSAPPVYADGVLYTALATIDRYRGRVAALDARSGRELWRFNTIPRPGEPGCETWPGDSEIWRWGGANVWLPPTVDLELGLLIFGTGNAFPYQGGELRPGDNLYTNSVVALDLLTGSLRWFFQTTHHDLWDTDIPTPIVLYDARQGSTTRKAVAAMRPDGILFMLDRSTGKSLFPIEERPVIQNPLDRTSPTQPYPLGVQSILPDCESYRSMVPAGFELGCAFVPPSIDQPVLSTGIGVRLRPMSYSRETGYFYAVGAAGLEWPRRTSDPWVTMFSGAAHVPGLQRSRSTIVAALNSRSGKLIWRSELPGQGGGLLSTAGGLVFQRAGNGDFRAYDSRNGQMLWKFTTGQGAGSMSPISYSVHGEQYVSVVEGPEVWSFKLGGLLPQRDGHLGTPSPSASEEDFLGPIHDTRIITTTSLVQEDIYQSGPHFGIDEYSFNPYRARVRVGEPVTFANNGHITHSMASVDGSWSTGPLLPGDAVDLVFDKEGKYTYFSKESPFQYGQLTVVAATPVLSTTENTLAKSFKDRSANGKAVYEQQCAGCHGKELSGGDKYPALIGREFALKWLGKSAQDLFERIESSMPLGRPHSLDTTSYDDIVSFLISANEWEVPLNPIDAATRSSVMLTTQ